MASDFQHWFFQWRASFLSRGWICWFKACANTAWLLIEANDWHRAMALLVQGAKRERKWDMFDYISVDPKEFACAALVEWKWKWMPRSNTHQVGGTRLLLGYVFPQVTGVSPWQAPYTETWTIDDQSGQGMAKLYLETLDKAGQKGNNEQTKSRQGPETRPRLIAARSSFLQKRQPPK